MRKTKILKRLATITLSLALALSGVIPGMEPLEVQAESITITTQRRWVGTKLCGVRK